MADPAEIGVTQTHFGSVRCNAAWELRDSDAFWTISARSALMEWIILGVAEVLIPGVPSGSRTEVRRSVAHRLPVVVR